MSIWYVQDDYETPRGRAVTPPAPNSSFRRHVGLLRFIRESHSACEEAGSTRRCSAPASGTRRLSLLTVLSATPKRAGTRTATADCPDLGQLRAILSEGDQGLGDPSAVPTVVHLL